MSQAESVISLFEQALFLDRELQQRARAEEKGTTLKTNPYVTDAGSKCPRKTWYTLRNYPVTDPPTADSLANFLLGKAAEEAFAKILEQMGVRVVREVRVALPCAAPDGEMLDVTGRLDFLLYFENGESPVLIEMKTTSRLAMKLHGYKPYDDHVSQLNLYLHASQEGLISNLPPVQAGVVFYYIKDASKRQRAFYAFDVPYDPARALDDLALLVNLDGWARLDPSPPERPAGFNPEKFPCSYCDFRTECWGARSGT